MKTRTWVLLLWVLACGPLSARPVPRVLFDASHGSCAGNADWSIGAAYSGLADTLSAQGFSVQEHRVGPMTAERLRGVALVVLPEPNRAYGAEERRDLRSFVFGGGGLFLIADHAGSDRDGDGVDSVDVLNQLAGPMGVFFEYRWVDEAPLRGPIEAGPLTRWVGKMGCWAATTVKLSASRREGGSLSVGAAVGGGTLLAGLRYGRGRVVALGDSSPFDDGTGDPTKKLLDTYNSFLYDAPQMGSNAVRWLAGLEPVRALPEIRVRLASREPAGWRADVLVDAQHFNGGADKMTLFPASLASQGLATVFADVPLTDEVFERVRLVFVDNPVEAFTVDEVAALVTFVRRGGRLLLACRGGGQRGGGRQEELNALLGALGSSLRFERTQVVDETSNYGKPWSLVVSPLKGQPSSEGVEKILFWNPCSIRAVQGGWPESATILATGGPNAMVVRCADHGQDPAPAKPPAPLVLIALEQLGPGRVLLMGTSCFNDFQYTEERRASGVRDALGVDKHETPLYNRRLVEHLLLKPAPPAPLGEEAAARD